MASGGSQLYGRHGTELDERPERQSLEVKTGSRDAFAELSRSNLEVSRREGCEEFGWDQVNLPQIGKPRLTTSEIAGMWKDTPWRVVTFSLRSFRRKPPRN